MPPVAVRRGIRVRYESSTRFFSSCPASAPSGVLHPGFIQFTVRHVSRTPWGVMTLRHTSKIGLGWAVAPILLANACALDQRRSIGRKTQHEYSILRSVRTRVVSRRQELLAASWMRCLTVSADDRRWLAASLERIQGFLPEWLELEARILRGAAAKGEVRLSRSRLTSTALGAYSRDDRAFARRGKRRIHEADPVPRHDTDVRPL